jgi:glycosyltransferase involved in cell wall biosynthesis
LYNELQKSAKVTVIGTRLSDLSSNEDLKIIRGWAPGILGIFQALKQCIIHRGDIFHIQAELIVFRSILGTFFLPFMIMVLRLTSRPVVVTLHGLVNLTSSGVHTYDPDNLRLQLFEWTQWLIPFLARAHVMAICSMSSKIIVHNHLMKEELVGRYGVQANKIIVIPHGVTKANYSDKIQYAPFSHKLLFFGFLRPSKGLEYLVKAFEKSVQKIPDIHLMITGGVPFEDEKYKRRLRELVNSLGINEKVEISESMVPENEIGGLITSSDMIVLPYLDNFIESSGALADVMDYGKPVICTCTPRFRADLISGKECLMVQPGDVDGLCEAILTLLQDTKLAENIGLNLKMKAQNRYWEIIAQRLLREVYEPLVMKRE